MSTEVAEEPTEPAAEKAPSRRRRTGWLKGTGTRRIAVLPWALFAIALAAAVLFAVLWRGAQGQERRRAEVASEAGRFLTALTNFKGATIDSDVAAIRSFAVGDFAGQLEHFFGQEAMDALRQAGAQSVGRVHSVFVESLAGDSATVFGVVDESVVNAANPVPRTEVLRVEIEMIHTTGGWKVESANILQSPGEVPFSPGG
jgi:hypothetical protein